MNASPIHSGDGEANDQSLAIEVERLTNELEAARIERDRYRAATETMAQALARMDQLLHQETNLPEPEA